LTIRINVGAGVINNKPVAELNNGPVTNNRVEDLESHDRNNCGVLASTKTPMSKNYAGASSNKGKKRRFTDAHSRQGSFKTPGTNAHPSHQPIRVSSA
jgi:hypothetical protein